MVFLKQLKGHKINLLLVLIIFLASFMRLYRIGDYMTFLGDEGRDVLVVYNILHGHLTLLGPTASVGGFFFGPLYYYMMAPFLWLFHYNPVGPAVMVALFGIATVWLVYKIGTEFFNRSVGLIAAFFYAISPLVLVYSRSSWNPNTLPFFSLLTMYFSYRGSITEMKKKDGMTLRQWGKWFLFSGICLGIAVELHFITLFLGAALAVFLLGKALIIDKQKVWSATVITLLQEYALIFTGFLIGMLPYLAFEVRHSFSNSLSIFNFIFHSKQTGGNSHFFQTIGDVFFRIFGHLIANYPTPDHTSSFDKNSLIPWFIFTIVLAIGSFGLIVMHFLKTKQYTEERLKISLLIVWFVIGICLFGFYKKNIYDYYFTFLFALPFFFTAHMLYVFWQGKIVGKVIAGILFTILVFLAVAGEPFRFEPNKQLLQTETISRFVLDNTNNRQFNFALITGGNSDHAYRYFFTIWGHPPVTIQNMVNDPQRKSTTNQLLIVCESLPCYPLGHPLFEIAGFGRAEIAGHWKVSVVEVYKLVHFKEK